MKATLKDLESHFAPPAWEEAMELVKETNEYDLTQPQANYFHVLSKNPDYHVEMMLADDGSVTAKCHCSAFKRSGICKHALAALIILRDRSIRRRRNRSRLKHEKILLDEVLKKLNVTELRKFVATHAHSHSAFRAEVLANYLHRIRRPDYHHLLNDMTPMDKYGIIKLNRNNLKSVRNIVAILHRQAQDLLKENALPQTIGILEATIPYLYRLSIKVPQFQHQLATELKHALKLFEAFCRLPMAPRLQKAAITLSMEVSGRDGFRMIKGTTTLLQSAEAFILEKKVRRNAFQLVEEKVATDTEQRILWGSLLIRWMRVWEMKPRNKEVKRMLSGIAPELVLELQAQRAYADVLYILSLYDPSKYDASTARPMLQAGLRAAKLTGDEPTGLTMAYALSVMHLDTEAWETLFRSDPESAVQALKIVHAYYPPHDRKEADHFLLSGLQRSGEKKLLLERLNQLDDVELLMQYDKTLVSDHTIALANMYTHHIHALRSMYGGETIRKKLAAIVYHLKDNELHTHVKDNLELMEKDVITKSNIRGFIFDLDGVIVDTAKHHFQSWQSIMLELGVEISEEDDAHTRGASRMESLEYLLQKYGVVMSEKEKESWAAKKNSIYLASIEQITPTDLLPGVLTFLEEARKSGFKLALGSASKNARAVLRKLEIENRFDAMLDGNDTTRSKPDPEIFIKGCEALKLPASEVVVFEDAAKGVQAAIDAGCHVVGIGSPQVLAKAAMTIDGLHQIEPKRITEVFA